MSKDNVVYLQNASRACGDCGQTRAPHDRVMRDNPDYCFTATANCQKCGDVVEARMPEPKVGDGRAPACFDCGSTDALAEAEVSLPEGAGAATGYLTLCGECVALYDEGKKPWRHG